MKTEELKHSPMYIDHTPLPWREDEMNSSSIIDSGPKRFDSLILQVNGKNRDEAIKNKRLVLEACNNYYKLKEENARLREALNNQVIPVLNKAFRFVNEGVDMFESGTDAQNIKLEFQDCVNEIRKLIKALQPPQ